jgi:ParB family chromosome partitioning protein
MSQSTLAKAATVKLIDPRVVSSNPENPRLIFRQEELQALQDSIASQGILVPVSVFVEGNSYVLLDGERRWRCAVKLSLGHIPAIVQPKPDRLQNIMMMFAIHNSRKDWDPLPTAYKLRDLQGEFTKRNSRPPTEAELAELASLSRGEVRRLRQLLALPETYRGELMDELKKPHSEQVITVDHVLETTRSFATRHSGQVPVQGRAQHCSPSTACANRSRR